MTFDRVLRPPTLYPRRPDSMDTSRPPALGSLLGYVLLIPLVTGCANDNLNLADQSFGDSVRSMISQQTAYPRHGAGLDGQQAANALEEYRMDIAKRQNVTTGLTQAAQKGGGGVAGN